MKPTAISQFVWFWNISVGRLPC